MANIITSVFAIALVLGAVVLMTSASLTSASRISLAWSDMVKRGGALQRTELTLVSSDPVPTSTDVEISIRNTGQTALRDFEDWNVIIQYYATSSNQGMRIAWMTYTTSSTPPTGAWTVRGIYMDAGTLDPEVYDPNVSNPGEEMIVRLNITPAIPTDTDNLVTIGAPNGVTVAAPFSR